MQIVLASNNDKKLLELNQILPGSFQLLPASSFDIESPQETGLTFVENAIIKARHASHVAKMPAIADDSGLEVDFLSGAPGIHSARYAGASATDSDNNTKLLRELEGVPSIQRTARFRCVIVLLRHETDPMPLIASGTWEGKILEKEIGDKGFGYDPLFYVDALGVSSAQLSPEEKNQISHRAAAVEQLRSTLGRL